MGWNPKENKTGAHYLMRFTANWQHLNPIFFSKYVANHIVKYLLSSALKIIMMKILITYITEVLPESYPVIHMMVCIVPYEAFYVQRCA